MLPEAPEDLPDDLPVPGAVRVSDEDVVEVYHDVARQDEVLEDVVHHCLEGRGGVGQAEVHHQGFKEPPVRPERGLPFVAFPDPDVIETPPDVEFREEPGSFQSINKVVDQREGVPVLHGHRVQGPVVLNEPELSVLLLNEEDRGSHRGFRRPDPAGRKAFLDERVELTLFEGGDGVDLTVGRFRVRDEFDRMVPGPAVRERIERLAVEHVLELTRPLGNRVRTGRGVFGVCFRESLGDRGGSPDVFRRGERGVKDPVSGFDFVILVVGLVGVVQEQLRELVVVELIVFLAAKLVRVDRADDRDRAGSELPEDSGAGPGVSTLSPHFVATGRADGGASVHFDLPGLPVDLRVVLPEPGEPENELLLTKTGDSEDDALGVGIVPENHIDDLPDASGFVRGAVNIVDRDGPGERPDGDLVLPDVLGVDELGGRSAVDEPVYRQLYGVVNGFYLQR